MIQQSAVSRGFCLQLQAKTETYFVSLCMNDIITMIYSQGGLEHQNSEVRFDDDIPLNYFFFVRYFVSKSFSDSTAFGVRGIKAIILNTVISPTPISPKSHTKV